MCEKGVSAPPKRTAVRTCHRVRCAFVNVPALGRRTPVLAGASTRPGSRANASASSSPFPRARRAIGERVETFFSRRPRARSRRARWSTRAGPRWRRRPRRKLPRPAGAAASVAFLKTAENLRADHQQQAKSLKLRLKGMGLPIIDHGSHIVPVMVGNPVHTQMPSDMLLQEHGIYVQPINYPTVPRGTERLRFTPSPVHGPGEIEALVRAMDTLWAHCALNRAENAG